MGRTKLLHSMLDPLDPDAMNATPKRDSDPDTHAPVSDTAALDILAVWLGRMPGRRKVVAAEQHADGTFTFRLEHEHGTSGSYTQRTLSSAIRTALGIAAAAGAR